MEASVSEKKGASLWQRIVAGWIMIFFALGLAGWSGDLVESYWGMSGQLRYWIQALIMSGIVVPGILLLRSRFDRQPLAGLGLPGPGRSLVWFAFGVGIIAVPFIAVTVCTIVFGWATLTLNTSGAALSALSTAILIAFFFEALPEELAVRGYLYRNLNTRFARWSAALISVALFVMLPSCLTLVQHYVLGMEVRIGGGNTLTVGYLMTMALFGAFTVYLRILTGTIWSSVGFHLAFLQLNRIFGMSEASLIRVSDFTSEAPMQFVLIGSILLIFIALLAYPLITKRPIGWKETNPDE